MCRRLHRVCLFGLLKVVFFFVKSLEGALRHEWREEKERKEEKKTSSLLETEAVGMGTLAASSRGYFLFSSKSFHSNENINT